MRPPWIREDGLNEAVPLPHGALVEARFYHPEGIGAVMREPLVDALVPVDRSPLDGLC